MLNALFPFLSLFKVRSRSRHLVSTSYFVWRFSDYTLGARVGGMWTVCKRLKNRLHLSCFLLQPSSSKPLHSQLQDQKPLPLDLFENMDYFGSQLFTANIFLKKYHRLSTNAHRLTNSKIAQEQELYYRDCLMTLYLQAKSGVIPCPQETNSYGCVSDCTVRQHDVHIFGCKDTIHQAGCHFFSLYSPSPGRFKNEQLNLVNTEFLTAF